MEPAATGVGLPEQVAGTITLKVASGYTGLADIAGNPAESAIKMAVSARLVDGYPAGTYKPNQALTRRELAHYLVMGQEIRQFLPLDGAATFKDVAAADLPFAEEVAAKGAALRDKGQTSRGVMLPTGSGTFSPAQSVRRVDLAYSLVQSLGLESEALGHSNSVCQT